MNIEEALVTLDTFLEHGLSDVQEIVFPRAINLNVMNKYEYQIGGSLKVDAPSYVERQADSAISSRVKK